MVGERRALIVATDDYEHEALRRLRAPAADAAALARVLGDPGIGGFRVDVVLNDSAHDVAVRLEDLFAESRPDDLLLVHFSCHGLKSDSGELFFAASDTRPDRLGSTAVPATFVQRCLTSCRSRNVVLLLDCCYGGAFGQGVAVRASGSAHVLDSFPSASLGGGRSRAVITASSAMEYAFEGTDLTDDHQQQPSLFTSAVVRGLETGEADRDQDGWVSLDELYDYVYDAVRSQNPHQTPSRDVEMQGELYLARSGRSKVSPVPIPDAVRAALADPNLFTRLGAVSELRGRLLGPDVAVAVGAHDALSDLVRTDIRYVADAAAEALDAAALRVEEAELAFGEVGVGDEAMPRDLRLSGPPFARACTFSASEQWIRLDVTDTGVRVSVVPSEPGPLHGSVTVTGPAGEVVVAVTGVATSVARPSTGEAPSADRVVGQAPGAARVEDHRPTQRHPVRPALASPVSVTVERRAMTEAGLSLGGGAAMVVGVYLPFQWGSTVGEQAAYAVGSFWLVGALAMAGGWLRLARATATWVGPGVQLSAGSGATWGLALLIAYPPSQGVDGLGTGFSVEVVAHLLVAAAAVLVALRLTRAADPTRAVSLPRDWVHWSVVVLASASAVLLVITALRVSEVGAALGATGVWAAVLAAAVPIRALWLRPRLLGGAVLVAWLVCGVALFVAYRVMLDYFGDHVPIDLFLITVVALAVLAPVWVLRGRRAPDVAPT